MTRSSSELNLNTSRGTSTWSRRNRLSSRQLAIEHHGVRLRERLRLSDLEALDQHDAFKLIPDCSIWALKNIPGISLRSLQHFRNKGIGCGAWVVQNPITGEYDVIYNDVHSPQDVRAYLMEEFFHIWLAHKPDQVRVHNDEGAFRTYSKVKEDEAEGCAATALVPFKGLESLLAWGESVRQIADRYVVSTSLIDLRIKTTGLSALSGSSTHQLQLMLSTKRFETPNPNAA